MDDINLSEKFSDEFRAKLVERINGISSLFKLNYPLNPKCQYLYPPINQVVIQNIVNALIANQKFYVQTLHLMNKMCLPCPFIPNSYTFEIPVEANLKFPDMRNLESDKQAIPVDMSTSESEIESDTDIDAEKSQLKRSSKGISAVSNIKRLKLSSFVNKPSENKTPKETTSINVEEIFEKNDVLNKDKVTNKSKGAIKVTSGEVEKEVPYKIVESKEPGFGKIVPLGKSEDMVTEQLEIESKEETKEFENTSSEFISKEELDKNRLKTSELLALNAYKNYDRGEISSRLYIKNLGKKVEESHLRHIYGRYIDFSNEQHKNSFDIRIMKEGRMKGQAFVNLPSEAIAMKALQETNGYMLADKAIIVQFARSAKPK